MVYFGRKSGAALMFNKIIGIRNMCVGKLKNF